MGLGRVGLPGVGQPPPMERRNPLALRPGGVRPCFHGCDESGVDLTPQGLPLGILLLGQRQDAGVGPVHLLISVFLPDLLPEGGLIGLYR
ncbi:30S ribosomal protein S15, partial [Dysosmobacter welbionis]